MSGRRRSPSARIRIASAGSSVVRTSGRPSPAVSRGAPGVVEAGHADDDRVLDRRDLLDPQPDRRLRPRPGRDAVGDVGGRADRFARDDDEPDVERRVVDGDRVEALADLERHALPVVLERHPAAVAPELEAGPPEDERAMGVVLELVLGVDPAADLDVARRPPAASARASATLTSGVEASSRPTR